MPLESKENTIDWTDTEDNILTKVKSRFSAANTTVDVDNVLREFPWACSAGYLRVVKYLAYQGAHLTHQGAKENALCLACENGHLNVAEFLVSEGAKINSYILSRAIHFKHTHVIKYLIKHGGDINEITNKADKYFALTCMFGTPAKSVKDLTPENEKYLPALLQRLFDIKKISPYDYLLTCPEWHKPTVMDMIG